MLVVVALWGILWDCDFLFAPVFELGLLWVLWLLLGVLWVLLCKVKDFGEFPVGPPGDALTLSLIEPKLRPSLLDRLADEIIPGANVAL